MPIAGDRRRVSRPILPPTIHDSILGTIGHTPVVRINRLAPATAQLLFWAFAALMGIPAQNVTIRSPFLGGGFGSKGFFSGPQILGVLAARLVGKPVKLAI